MSANSENPRSEAHSGDKSSGEGGDFESGLDYGAFAGDEPDFPEDHLEAEEPQDKTAAQDKTTAEDKTTALDKSASSEQPPMFSAALSGDGDADPADTKAGTPAPSEKPGASTPDAAQTRDAQTRAAQAPDPQPAAPAAADGDQPTTVVPPVPADNKTRALNDTAGAAVPGTAASSTRSTAPADDAAKTGASPAGASRTAAPEKDVPAEEQLSNKERRQRDKEDARRQKEEAKAEKQSAKHARKSQDDDAFTPYAGGASSYGAGSYSGTVGRTPSGEEITDQDLNEEVEKEKRGVSRFMQVLIAIFFPLLVTVAAIRLIASPVFLWLSYNRPGFPDDAFGFSGDDRLVYGSYGLDYLFNFANSRYLSELAPEGEQLFADAEVAHMTDVKFVMMWAMLAAVILLVLTVLFGLLLRSWRPGGFVRGLFAGAWVTVGLIVAVAVLAILNWQMFFEEFHRLFFADGTWTFSEDSTLIRLYPEQFWIDAGIGVAALVLLISLVVLITTWPSRRRRERRAARLGEVKERRREKLIAELTKGTDG